MSPPLAPATCDLSGTWELERDDQAQRRSAHVPGSVHLDLLAAGLISDPWWRDDERRCQWVHRHGWTWTRDFTPPPGLLERERIILRCEGLDTLATVRVNGAVVIEAANMFRTWEADLRPHLRPGANRIEVLCHPVLPHLAACQERRALTAQNTYHADFAGKPWLRKMQAAFGWDWGPMLPTCGIWRPLAIHAWDGARLSDLRLDQRHAAGAVTLVAHTAVERSSGSAPRLRLRAQLDGRLVAQAEGPAELPLELAIPAPRLWWPNGQGEQPLYQVEAELLVDGAICDRQEHRIGLRTIVLDRSPDAEGGGESFAFVVNGRRIFAKGANWIPADILLHRVDRARYARLLEAAAASGMNMIRCWGGGIYEQEDFYALCDELGLLVWQDFMFACQQVPGFDPAWLDDVRAEAVDNVRRLRHHPCLALWCGNNEIERALVGPAWEGRKMSWEDYGAVFDRLLPAVVAQEDPATPYWPSSPHTPRAELRHQADHPDSGDAHNWGCWFHWLPFEAQRDWRHRFMSEFGFQSFPEPRTVEGFTLPEDRSITSYVMDYHQRSVSRGNKTIMAYILDWFRPPRDFAAYCRLSQLVQGLCVQMAAEHTRRQQPRTQGCLYWQLNDCWPAPTWSSIDVHGRWKALQHLARRFNAPLLTSGLEDLAGDKAHLHCSNHGIEEQAVELRWRATDCAGTELAAGSFTGRVPPQADRRLGTVDCAALRRRLGGEQALPLELRQGEGWLGRYDGDRELLIWIEALADGAVASCNLLLFARPKHLALRDPDLAATVTAEGDGFRIAVHARRPALWVRLDLDGEDADWSDNWFHHDGRGERIVHCRPWRTLGLDELRSKLRLGSLVDLGT